jgi:hypothetical protein
MGKCWERSFSSIKIGQNIIAGHNLSSDANILIENCEGTFVGAIENSEEFDNEKRGKYYWSSDLAIVSLFSDKTGKDMYIVKEYTTGSDSYNIPPYQQETDFFLARDDRSLHYAHTAKLIENLKIHDVEFCKYFDSSPIDVGYTNVGCTDVGCIYA